MNSQPNVSLSLSPDMIRRLKGLLVMDASAQVLEYSRAPEGPAKDNARVIYEARAKARDEFFAMVEAASAAPEGPAKDDARAIYEARARARDAARARNEFFALVEAAEAAAAKPLEIAPLMVEAVERKAGVRYYVIDALRNRLSDDFPSAAEAEAEAASLREFYFGGVGAA